MDDKFVSVFGAYKLKILVICLLCISFSESHNFWKLQSNITTWNRVKRQDCGFNCKNGDCISMDNVCDGTVECADGSDETKELCSGIPCASYLFRCNYGACINKAKLCNGIKDCADNSDETGQGCTSGSSSCSPSEFRCQNNECIDAYLVCDGRKDCKDGSDETAESCVGNICASFLIKCNYGACVEKKARCNGIKECADGSDEFGCGGTPVVTTVVPDTTVVVPVTTSTSDVVPNGGCRLLNHPTNGRRVFKTNREYIPNTPVNPSTVITIECNYGFKASDLRQEGAAFCIDGMWIGDIENNICKKTCPPLTDKTYTATCTRNSKEMNCLEAVEGTIAATECVNFYTSSYRPKMKCTNGQWSPNLGSCELECGIKRVNVQTLIIGGSPAVRAEYPWLVAVYGNTEKETNTHLCGGSILNQKYVLSAAHCFTDPTNGDLRDKNTFTLIAGKFYRDINDDRDKDTQQVRKIDQLIVHERYRGGIRNYEYDIALVKLNQDLIIGLEVQPVCVDYQKSYEEISLTENNNGVVAGWGFTSVGSDPAKELKKLIVPIKGAATCQRDLPKDFVDQYYARDKLCGGYKDQGVSVCSGDSGGGYYFQSNARFYIRGIVSLAPRGDAGCDKRYYGLYTRVSDYFKWLENNMIE